MADAAEEHQQQKREVVSKGARAGLTFAVSRVEKKLRQGRISKAIGTQASVFLTGAVERVVEELLAKADEQAAERKSKRLTDVHIVAAARSNPDLARVFQGFCFASDADVPKAIDRILPDNEQKVRKRGAGAVAAGAPALDD